MPKLVSSYTSSPWSSQVCGMSPHKCSFPDTTASARDVMPEAHSSGMEEVSWLFCRLMRVSAAKLDHVSGSGPAMVLACRSSSSRAMRPRPQEGGSVPVSMLLRKLTLVREVTHHRSCGMDPAKLR